MSTPAPTITGFDATPNIVSLGDSSILKWSVTGTAETVDIEPGIGVVALTGSREVTPSSTTNYTLTARNKDKVKTATLQLVVTDKKVSSDDQADSSSASKESQVPAPAPSSQAPNVIVVTVPAASSVPSSNTNAVTVQESAPQAEKEAPVTAPVSTVPAAAPAGTIQQASTAPVATQASAIPASSAPESNPEPVKEATAQVLEDPVTGALYSEASASSVQSGSDVSWESSAPAGSSIAPVPASQPPAAVSIGGSSEPKPGVKQITSADWNPSNNASSSLDKVSQEAPIYSKLRSSGHQPGQSPDPLSMGSEGSDVSISELP